MRTPLKFITALLITIATINVTAAESRKSEVPERRKIAAPAFQWGNAEDLNEQGLEALKVIPIGRVETPEFSWGSPADLNDANLEKLKVTGASLALPIFTWGDPGDLEDFKPDASISSGFPIKIWRASTLPVAGD